MGIAEKSGMRGHERKEAPANREDKGTDPYGEIGAHVKSDADGQQHINRASLVDHLEQQKSGPHDDRAGEFKKPNADKFTPGASKDSAKDAMGNESQ